MFMPSGVAAASDAGTVVGQYAITADTDAFATGYFRGSYGSILPDIPLNIGGNVDGVQTGIIIGGLFTTISDSPNPDQDFFTAFEIVGAFNTGQQSHRVLTVDANFAPGPAAVWQWPLITDLMIVGNTYFVTYFL